MYQNLTHKIVHKYDRYGGGARMHQNSHAPKFSFIQQQLVNQKLEDGSPCFSSIAS